MQSLSERDRLEYLKKKGSWRGPFGTFFLSETSLSIPILGASNTSHPNKQTYFIAGPSKQESLLSTKCLILPDSNPGPLNNQVTALLQEQPGSSLLLLFQLSSLWQKKALIESLLGMSNTNCKCYFPYVLHTQQCVPWEMRVFASVGQPKGF